VLRLSDRETEALFSVTQGKSNPEIAVILGIGRRTVATRMEHILAKLSVENRGAASRCASEVLFG
jgi:DNA-binding CsgD family transcriptional regulator